MREYKQRNFRRPYVQSAYRIQYRKMKSGLASILKQKEQVQKKLQFKKKARQQIDNNNTKYLSCKSEVNNNTVKKSDAQKPKHIDQSVQNKQQQKLQEEAKPQSNNNMNKELQESVKNRNKRIFGGLTSYLKKASQQLETKEEKTKLQAAKSVLQKVKEKQRNEVQQLQKKKKKILEEQIETLEQRLKILERQFLEAQNKFLAFISQTYLKTLGENFILTKTQPQIFWKPNKKTTQTKETQQISLDLIKKIKKNYDDYITNYKPKSHSTYISQNQKQYYENKTMSMYAYHRQFFVTQSEPCIFWKPNQMIDENQKLSQMTKEKLQQKTQKLFANLRKYQQKPNQTEKQKQN